jgi:uncharacterized protein YabN with tetrapyrrole methylase and pyrophosphatase domain
MTPQPIDLYLLGAGVAFPDHLTLQTIDILSKCTRIWTNLAESRIGNLPPDLREKCVSLTSLYKDGRLREDNYRDVTHAVICGIESARPGAWLTPGHPMIFDSVSGALLKATRRRKWNVCVVPAISSLDTLLAEVAYDPANGLAIHDATSLVQQKSPLQTSVAVVLLQISVFLSDRAHISLERVRPDLTVLRDYLTMYFPAFHRCAVVYSSQIATEPPRITWVALQDLASLPAEVLGGASLFVPRLEAPPR